MARTRLDIKSLIREGKLPKQRQSTHLGEPHTIPNHRFRSALLYTGALAAVVCTAHLLAAGLLFTIAALLVYFSLLLYR